MGLLQDGKDDRVTKYWQTSCLQTGTTTRCLAFNPLAGEEPVEGVHWQKGANFGKATGVDAYQLPRTYRFWPSDHPRDHRLPSS